jgi:hypothetical protein
MADIIGELTTSITESSALAILPERGQLNNDVPAPMVKRCFMDWEFFA